MNDHKDIDVPFVAFHGIQNVVKNPCKSFVSKKGESIHGIEVTSLELSAAS